MTLQLVDEETGQPIGIDLPSTVTEVLPLAPLMSDHMYVLRTTGEIQMIPGLMQPLSLKQTQIRLRSGAAKHPQLRARLRHMGMGRLGQAANLC